MTKHKLTGMDLLLESRGKTRQDIATLLGMTRSNAGHHIRGAVMWRVGDLEKIAQYLNVSVQTLVNTHGYRVRKKPVVRKVKKAGSIAAARLDPERVITTNDLVFGLLTDFEHTYDEHKVVDLRIIKLALGVLKGKCAAELRKLVGDDICQKYFGAESGTDAG